MDLPAADPPELRTKPATIYDVARRAGVSHATVTRFIKGFEGIRPDTRARVEKALGDLDYRPNLTARSLITGRAHRIGALTHEIDQVGPSRSVQGAAAAARRAGYVLDIVTVDPGDDASIQEGLTTVAQPGIAGVLIFSSTDEMRSAYDRMRFRVPVLFLSESDGIFAGPDPSPEDTIDQVVGHLVSLGHRSLFHVAGPPNWTPARNRDAAFRAALERRALAPSGSANGDWSAASGYAIASRIPPGVTAVVASNDQMALGVMLFLRERGISVPDDVSVTGIDDIPEAAFFAPPLTTVRIDFGAHGAQSLSDLLVRIDPDHPPVPYVPPPRLMVRASSGPVRTRSAQRREVRDGVR